MTYLNAEDYNEFYLNSQAQRENQEISRLLKNHKGRIIDIGCGTGLLSKLVDNEYLGVDLRMDYIEFAKSNERGKYICEDGLKLLKQFKPQENDLLVSIFAIDYMPLQFIDQMKKYNHFIISHNKPFLSGSGSFYANNELFFRKKHPNHKKYVEKLHPKAKLLNQDYYFITSNLPKTDKNGKKE